ncbi:NADP-dependent oxidoreductase [Aquipuribacter sp. SD81]|uniref:NADP-dependent oxidoreductase n=1 Tax=Aquipuribacter sp. SD81 TaxID=3127703 RepID=UPI00301922FE
MKAVRFHEYGDPDVLRLEEVPDLVPGPGQVLVRVAGTSFNGVDANIRAGAMQGPMPVTLPHVPGVDVAGTVAGLGEGVTGLAVGDAVMGFLPFTADGAAAEQVLAPAEVLAPAPTTVPLADAAAVPVVALTAWQSLVEHGGLRPGQRVLISGAGGAVGGYAVQLAHALGAHVVAVAGPGSRERLLARGADEVVDRTSTSPADALTDRVDVVLNLAPLSPEALADLVPLVRDGGVVVSTTVWLPTPGDEARGVRAVDVFVRSDAAQLADLASRVDRGGLVVDVAERVPLSALADVHARAAAGRLGGKVVVLPAAGG